MTPREALALPTQVEQLQQQLAEARLELDALLDAALSAVHADALGLDEAAALADLALVVDRLVPGADPEPDLMDRVVAQYLDNAAARRLEGRDTWPRGVPRG